MPPWKPIAVRTTATKSSRTLLLEFATSELLSLEEAAQARQHALKLNPDQASILAVAMARSLGPNLREGQLLPSEDAVGKRYLNLRSKLAHANMAVAQVERGVADLQTKRQRLLQQIPHDLGDQLVQVDAETTAAQAELTTPQQAAAVLRQPFLDARAAVMQKLRSHAASAAGCVGKVRERREQLLEQIAETTSDLFTELGGVGAALECFFGGDVVTDRMLQLLNEADAPQPAEAAIPA